MPRQDMKPSSLLNSEAREEDEELREWLDPSNVWLFVQLSESTDLTPSPTDYEVEVDNPLFNSF